MNLSVYRGRNSHGASSYGTFPTQKHVDQKEKRRGHFSAMFKTTRFLGSRCFCSVHLQSPSPILERSTVSKGCMKWEDGGDRLNIRLAWVKRQGSLLQSTIPRSKFWKPKRKIGRLFILSTQMYPIRRHQSLIGHKRLPNWEHQKVNSVKSVMVCYYSFEEEVALIHELIPPKTRTSAACFNPARFQHFRRNYSR